MSNLDNENKNDSNVEAIKQSLIQKKHIPIFIYVLIVVFIVFATVFVTKNILGKNNNSSSNNNGANNYVPPTYEPSPTPSDNDQTPNPSNKAYGFNETFVFDNLEITIGNNYSFDIVRNTFSDYNKKTVVKLPITVKNISNVTHGLNMFYYDVYGSYGTKVETLGSYFDNNIDHAGDLRSSASYTRYMYFLYDGDGTYAIEFNNHADEISVEFEIIKK